MRTALIALALLVLLGLFAGHGGCLGPDFRHGIGGPEKTG